MSNLLPDSELVTAIVQWLLFAILVALAVGVGTFVLALAVSGLDRVKREGKKLLGRPDVLTVVGEIAEVDLGVIHQYMDEPTDVLITLMARLLQQEPGRMVETVERAFVLFGKIQGVWPEIKEELGIVDANAKGEEPVPPVEVVIGGASH